MGELVNVVPMFTSLVTEMVPWSGSTTFFAMAKLRPLRLVVRKSSKMTLRHSGGMPDPASDDRVFLFEEHLDRDAAA